MILPTILSEINRYMQGIRPGSFLLAILSNDLMTAVDVADTDQRRNIGDTAKFVRDFMPLGCYGKEENVEDWLKLCESEEESHIHTVKGRRKSFYKYMTERLQT